ncbi:15-hydroxyprostaglandin dehydrogenase [NAD(+)]-like [Aricia agestis]|uniref:15-hydroxyprostaglandin dehydrogenase [NAD(+)]-like n=1 Tax=Aricia agestis TaxID=91739 RepID=UPI001C20BF9F|nr:15-hydroxyprostaglandin dehydrogenase [NAD(+)]-like [Aricia agestis]
MASVEGITLVVTGGAEGLGFSMVENFLQGGAKLAIILDVNEQKGAEAIKTVKAKYGDKAVFLKCDVTKDLDAVFDKVMSEYGPVDLLVNNAGVLAEHSYNKTIDINTTAVIAWSLKFYDAMRKDRGGRGGTIINVSSIYGYRISAYIPIYHASKFAVLGFSKSLGHKINFERSGVRVVTLCPGLTHTTLASNVHIREDEFLEEFKEEVKLLEWQTPESIGRGTVAIYRQAASGEVWLVEGERPAEKINV